MVFLKRIFEREPLWHEIITKITFLFEIFSEFKKEIIIHFMLNAIIKKKTNILKHLNCISV